MRLIISSFVSVPQSNASFPRPNIDGAIAEAVQTLNYSSTTYDQANAIREFVLGRDVFVTLPTGSGTSLCYAALPYVFDSLREHSQSPSIVVVVCPLVMKYMARGLQVALIGKAQWDEGVRKAVANGS